MSADVCLAFCHREDHATPLFQTTLWRLVSDNPGLDIIDMSSGPGIASSRNEMAFTFLARERKPQWYFMLDADMSCPPDTITRLLEYADPKETPILGALCFVVGKSGKVEPTLKVTDQVNGGLTVLWDYPEDSVVSIDATGAAALMVHRSVFETLAEKYQGHAYPFFAEASHGGLQFGEDVAFCVRARHAGFPVKVHTGIEVGHVKPYVFSSYDYKEYRRRVAEIGEEAYTAEYAARQGLLRRPSNVTTLRPSRRERRAQARRAAR